MGSRLNANMTPPAIRYPLPALALLVLLGLVTWRGADSVQAIRSDLTSRWAKLTERPAVPFPASTDPLVLAGAIHERVLILEDEVPYSAQPDGPTIGFIRHREFADFYDRWPIKGDATHIRVGNRRPLGWVEIGKAISWTTRLVLLPSEDHASILTESGASFDLKGSPKPILGQNPNQLHIHNWGETGAWHVGGQGVVLKADTVPANCWGVWLTRSELLALIGRDRSQLNTSTSRPNLVIRALLGLPINDRPLSSEETGMALTLLGPAVSQEGVTTKLDALARLNEEWKPDAVWGGVEYRGVRLIDIP